jgi:hypothetical protein
MIPAAYIQGAIFHLTFLFLQLRARVFSGAREDVVVPAAMAAVLVSAATAWLHVGLAD